MKRILLLLIITIAGSLQLKAQEGDLTFGPKLGLNIANMAKNEGGGVLARLQAGVVANYRFSYRFALQGEIVYSGSGTSIYYEPIDDVVHLNLNYINVPILAKVFIVGGLNIEAGAQIGFLVSNKINYRGDKQSNNLPTNALDFSIPVGIGYEFDSGWNFGVRYSSGLSDIFGSSVKFKDLKNSRNNVLTVSAGFRF